MTEATLYWAAATCRVRAAEHLRTMEMHSSALLLLREASLLAAKAHWAARFGAASQPPDDAATILEQCTATPRRLLETLSLEPINAENLPKAELLQRVAELETDVGQLLKELGPRAPDPRTQKRKLWLIGTIAAVVLAVSCLGYAHLFPTNIALYKRITANGVASFGTTTPYGIVDGRTHGALGYHSDEGPDRSVTIDLGRVHWISGGEVWGRHDCCFDQSIPLLLEVSDDDRTYRTVLTRSEPFKAHFPWEFRLKAVEARFVRLRVPKHGVLALNEVRLFGRP
jgi:hypothetical protein